MHINGEYRDDTPLGKLMHDFSCWDPDEMSFPLMKEAAKYYKENPEGVEFMCKAFEEVRDESYNRGMQQKEFSNIKSLMRTLKLSPKQAMDALSIPPEDQKKYTEMLSA